MEVGIQSGKRLLTLLLIPNHCTTDELCQKWCNPAPQDGSAPNLVIVAQDDDGTSYYKRAFNTQVQYCVQLFHIYNN